MNFKPELAALVMDGAKTCTRRLVSDNPRSPWAREKCGYRVGQEVAICPGRGKHQIGRARVVSVERLTLGIPSHDEAIAEGFSGPLAFVEAWESINGAYDPHAVVWRVGLQAVRVFEVETCGAMMIGSGTDTYDPLCELPRLHRPPCRSTAAIDQHRIAA